MPSSFTVRGFDFSHPDELLKCLWEAQFGANPDPRLIERFWTRDFAIVKELHSAVFDLKGFTAPGKAAHEMIVRLAKDKHPRGTTAYHMPREWLFIFQEAFEAGLLGREAWGKAARLTYTASDAPLGGSQEETERALAALRLTTPGSFMLPKELQAWLALPETTVAFRGSCADTFEEAAHGISWSTKPSLAVSYARARTIAHYQHGREGGLPALVEARVPKNLVFGVVIVGFGMSAQIELLVDYPRLKADAIKRLGLVEDPSEQAKLRQHWRGISNHPNVIAEVA